MKTLFLTLTFFLNYFIISNNEIQLSKSEQKIFNKTISSVWKGQAIEVITISFKPEALSMTGVFTGDKLLFKILIEKNMLGYALVDRAKGRFHEFMYMIVLSPELKILKAQILAYGEKHGAEICNEKWLNQFYQKSPMQKPVSGTSIDVISGATISSTSLTKKIAENLEMLQLLKTEKLI